MDENELAHILQQPNTHQIPHETDAQANEFEDHQEDGEEIVFVEAATVEEDIQVEESFEDDEDGEYEPDDEEDIPLEADDDGENEDNHGVRRTGRVRVPPQSWQHLQARKEQTEEYSSESAQVIAMTMLHYNTTMAGMDDLQTCSFLQTYSLKQGIKKFGERGVAAAHKEMRQLHDRVVFEPISIEEMTSIERKLAMESLIFLNKNRDETVKARMCANGSSQRAYIAREDVSSPTATSEAIITTGVIDAKQRCDVMTLDIPNAFVQTKIPLNGDKIIMKIRGQLVDILLELCVGVYDDYVRDER